MCFMVLGVVCAARRVLGWCRFVQVCLSEPAVAMCLHVLLNADWVEILDINVTQLVMGRFENLLKTG